MNVRPAILLLLTSALLGQAEPPSERVIDCTSSGCHAEQMDFEFLHGPTAAGACKACHEYDDPAAHTFTLKRQGSALCDFCHIGKTDTAGLHMHAPVESGECIKCHNPHGSNARMMLQADTTGELCITCHEPVEHSGTNLHTPVAQGKCLDCHEAHSSVLPQLLVEQGRALCAKCHPDQARLPATQAAHSHFDGPRDLIVQTLALLPHDPPATQPSEFVHEPLVGDCTQCHHHHGSDVANLLTKQPQDLCISCHADVGEKVKTAKVAHEAVTDSRACLNCHEPHRSTIQQLLTDRPVNLCLQCHNKPIKREDGTSVAAVTELKDPTHHLHGALKEQQCRGCHDVHGGKHRSLLTQPYTQNFYQPFKQEAYALCFSCHDSQLATKPTTTATGFRNGEQNLHYIHVTAGGEKGRSCRVCHTAHASASPKQLRESVPFGEWQLPINFKATETGGECGAGCHRARQYDRESADGSAPPPS